MMGGMDPPDPTEPAPRSSFEDFEIPVPTPTTAPSRPGIVITAAVVLAISGLLNVLFVVLFSPGGAAVPLLLALGAVQLVAVGMILALLPAGRWLGIGLGAIGIVLGLARASDDAVSALFSVALNAFVIYALGVSGPSFRRG